jgi:peptide/nickel transport system substrate-binding protein
MTRHVKLFAIAAILGMVAVACGGNGNTGASTTSPGAKLQSGGTLRIGMNSDVFTGFDPQKEYYQVSFAFYRCCLLRTLLSYNGKDSAHGGNVLQPDLATALPTESSDGLTWTFKMKAGLHYAPPMQDTEITSPDIVRAVMREATPAVAAGYPFYYSVIQGFDDYSSGKANTISGLETPDPHTLVVHLTQAAGYLGYMFAMAATAPIPPSPTDPSAPLGVATGHDDDYGNFMVASGPYMWEGSDKLDFTQPAKDQKAVAGYQPNKFWSLVRNPSWSDDDLRPAYVDAIQVTVSTGADLEVLDKKVQNNELDTVFQNGVPPTVLRTFKTDPSLQSRIYQNPSPGNYYIGMNLATPPFDDIHVRKAVQYAIDKAGMQKISGGPPAGEIANHFVPDGLLTTSDGKALLADYNPYPSTNSQGADAADGLAAAKAEMKQSKYDTNGDGVCDAPECSGFLSVGANDTDAEAQNALIDSNLKKIGLSMDLKEFDGGTAYAKLIDPKNKIALMLTPGWLQDWPDAFTFFYLTMYGPNILSQGNSNYTLAGATAAQLQKFGYDVSSVPSMDTQIQSCLKLVGDAAVSCWADADKYLMENIASVVPWIFSNTINVVSDRVQNYTYSAFDSQTAYDQIALAPGSS